MAVVYLLDPFAFAPLLVDDCVGIVPGRFPSFRRLDSGASGLHVLHFTENWGGHLSLNLLLLVLLCLLTCLCDVLLKASKSDLLRV